MLIKENYQNVKLIFILGLFQVFHLQMLSVLAETTKIVDTGREENEANSSICRLFAGLFQTRRGC